jgi:hypothetical protein
VDKDVQQVVELDLMFVRSLNRLCKDSCQWDSVCSGFHEQGLVCHSVFYKVELHV